MIRRRGWLEYFWKSDNFIVFIPYLACEFKIGVKYDR